MEYWIDAQDINLNLTYRFFVAYAAPFSTAVTATENRTASVFATVDWSDSRARHNALPSAVTEERSKNLSKVFNPSFVVLFRLYSYWNERLNKVEYRWKSQPS